MALKRSTMKAMGLTDEQIGSLIEMHTETVDGLKAEAAKYKADAEKLSAVQKELDDLKAAGDGGYKEKYEKEHKAFEDFKKEVTTEKGRAAKEKAFRDLLKEIGVSEKRMDAVMRVTDLGKVELDEDGKIKDADKVKDAAKTEWADFIVTPSTGGADTKTPPKTGSGEKLTKADLYKKDDHGRYIMSTADRQKALAANPELLN